MRNSTFLPALAALALASAFSSVSAQTFNVQVGAPPVPPVTTPLVNRADDWRWHSGTNAPQADWRTVADGGLTNSQWNSGPGGFGFGDPTIVGEATTLANMTNTYTTLYIRREFNVPLGLDTNSTLILNLDYDDGFVVYLNGAEVARGNVPGAPGSPVSNAALAGGSHEASCCGATANPATNVVLGTIGGRLTGPGPHILALIGVNAQLTSSDFHLIPSLSASTAGGGSGPVVNNGLYALSTTNRIALQGTNTLAGSTRVAINGDDASFNSVSGVWSADRVLTPGFNRLFITALDGAGNILSNLTQDVVYKVSALNVGGALAASTAWNDPSVVVHVTNSLNVPSARSLQIGPGVVVIVSAGASLLANAGGMIDIAGSDAARVWFLPAGINNFNEIAADGAASALSIRFADITRGAVKFRNGAVGLMEDTFHHNYKNGTVPIAGCTRASEVTVRRCHFRVYHETLWQFTVMTIEDSIFEDADNDSSDALDFDTVPPGSVIRRCTFRRGPNTNTDAVDIGSNSTNTMILSCIMHDFPNDKGVSIGEDSFGIVVSNCVMWANDSGVAVKDSCTAIISQNTISGCDFGLRLYNKANPASPTGGGHITNAANNIIWANDANFEILNAATVVSVYSDIQGTNFPGTGNLSVDPLFMDATQRDFRLQPGSPCLGTGLGGANMGAYYPVGGIGVEPTLLAATLPTLHSVTLTWRDNTDNEDGTVLERSLDGMSWSAIAVASANTTSYTDTGLTKGTTYAYRARTTNSSGLSPASNVTKGTTTTDITYAGGTLTGNTIWSDTIMVTNNVTVPGPFTLTLLPGTIVKLGNNLNVTASGGAVDVQGTAAQPVVIDRSSTNITRWGEFAATGAGASLTFRHARLSHGRVRAASGAALLAEDSEFFAFTGSSILSSSSAGMATIRRCHVHDYSSIDFVGTKVLAEDSLFEGLALASSDAFELQGSPAGSIVRRCTLRNATGPNTDALDMNGCTGVLIEDCLIYNISDKGISSGSATSASDPTSFGLVVRNTLIYDTAVGVSIKDNGTASIHGSVITGADAGLEVKPKFTAAGGHVTNGANNIIWGNTENLSLSGTGANIVLDFSDVEGTNQPGTGNFSSDPLWRNPENHDFRLLPGSPCLGTGANGANVGITYPVGGLPAPPATLTATLTNGSNASLAWSAAAYATSYVIERATHGGPFGPLAVVPATEVSFLDAAVAEGGSYGWRVRGHNFIGDSFNSPEATLTITLDTDGDGMPDAWELAHGLNPNVNDAALDADGDQMTNLSEYLAGTDPQSAASMLALQIAPGGAGKVLLSFGAVAGKSYTIQSRSNFNDAAWINFLPVPAAPVDRTLFLTNDATLLPRYFRAVTPMQ